MPTWCAPRRKPANVQTGGPGDWSAGCYLMMRFLPLFLFLPAPVEVILLVCMSSPMYLLGVRREARGRGQRATYDCRNLLPPSSFSCSDLTISTRSTISIRLAWRAFACLTKVSVGVHACGLERGTDK